ncbi:MAG TPA: hypothetical protein VFB60_24930 [Ktedonobacteraceae bacterium]|nr:hypothetical protein [Ktedonobacteraceae bacterium]
MSMSEFEESLPDENGSEDTLSHFFIHGRLLPDDFSAEDIAFAHELEVLLIPEQEQTPPYYVQTLLDSDDQRFQAVEPGFEKKVSARVFRRLSLSRRLYRSYESPLQAIRKTLSLSRSLPVVACLLFVFLTIVVTGPAFASGLAVLLSGKHSGVMLVQNYPTIAANASHQSQSSGVDKAARISSDTNLQDAQRQMNFQMYWPTSNALLKSYTLNKIYLYWVHQTWADGPILELDYQQNSPDASPLDPGRGKISICEFKPVGNVYQEVMLGAAQQIQIGTSGQVAIYVNGQWNQVNQTYEWQYGERSELIYEIKGVIFWIVGDQRDNIDSVALRSIADSLQALDIVHAAHAGSLDVTSSYRAPELFAGDIIFTDSDDGPSLVVGDDPSTFRNSIGVN